MSLQQQHTDGAAAAHVQLARLLAASKRLPQAAKHYNAALLALEGQEPTAGDDDDDDQRERVSSSSYWKALFELAHVKVQLRERDEAIALYRRIVEHNPQFAEAHANLAAQLMIDGDLESALHHCTTALAIAPGFREAHYNMNVLLRRAGRQQEAIERYWELMEKEIGEQLQLERRQTSDDSQTPATGSISASPSASLVREIGDEDHRPVASLPARVSVLCVKWGAKYGAEYVNKLYNSIIRNSNSDSNSYSNSNSTARGESAIVPAVEIDFVCLTDDASGIATDKVNLRCVSLEPGWKGWWNKLQVFSPRVSRLLPHNGKCLFVDLDTVIVDSLDKLLRWEIPKGEIALLKTDDMANERRRDGYNSSLMMWRNEHDAASTSSSLPFHHVYQLLHDHFRTISKFIYKFDHWLEMALPRVIFLEDVFPESIVEYRSLDASATMPPRNASIVCFPLQPKPHDASASWIQHHWQ